MISLSQAHPLLQLLVLYTDIQKYSLLLSSCSMNHYVLYCAIKYFLYFFLFDYFKLFLPNMKFYKYADILLTFILFYFILFIDFDSTFILSVWGSLWSVWYVFTNREVVTTPSNSPNWEIITFKKIGFSN